MKTCSMTLCVFFKVYIYESFVNVASAASNLSFRNIENQM